MKRLRRILLNGVTALLLLLFLATVALWLRSHIAFDSVVHPTTVPVFAGTAYSGDSWSPDLPVIYQLDSVKGRVRFLIARPVGGRLPWRELMTQAFVTLTPEDQGVDPFEWNRRFMAFGGTRVWSGLPGITRISGVSKAWLGQQFPLRAYEVRYWLLALAFGVLPLTRGLRAWVRVRRSRGRALAGRCANCGYDLRATPDRCPECGAVPDRAEPATNPTA